MDYLPPIKRSMTIAGHETSVSLEPVYWEALRDAATRTGIPINAVVARVDADRVAARAPANLASALRTFLFLEERALRGRPDA